MTPAASAPVTVAFVHHANQLLLGDGYANRDGLGTVVDGYARLLEIHEHHGVPAVLHLSGTLLEALAWGRPAFLEDVRRLAAAGVVELIGGTYAENVMPLFSSPFNRRQLAEAERLAALHLDRPPGSMAGCWVPERVWNTEHLAADLAAAGHRYVLLDDRLLFRAPGDRAAFDAQGPFAGSTGDLDLPGPEILERITRTYRIAGGHGLAVVPISCFMRYWIPPRGPDHWMLLDELFEAASTAGPHPLLVYADDLEKAAGVGGWEAGLKDYEAVVRWIAGQPGDVAVTRLDDWLERHPPAEERVLDPGTFYELAVEWGAREDYSGWWSAPAWRPYRERFARAERAIEAAAAAGGDEPLLGLARKHLLASAHETAWQDARDDGPGRAPAPWARAVASHAAACHVIADAARCLARAPAPARARCVDVDEDGEEEVVLTGGDLYAVVSPRHGGRLVELYQRTPRGGVLSIGNPTDHWNFQEARNRYMDVPANHPGAFADVGLEHTPYRVAALTHGTGHALVHLVPAGPASPRQRVAAKTFLLMTASPALVASYELADDDGGFETELCLSPDYLRLLREGRACAAAYAGPLWRGARAGDVSVWAAHAEDERAAWVPPRDAQAGHGWNLRLAAQGRRFRVLLGCGAVDAAVCALLFADAARILAMPAELGAVA